LIKDHKLELKHRASGSTEVLTLDQLYSKFWLLTTANELS
jgi:hypothetical protein